MTSKDHRLIALALRRDRERGGKPDRLCEMFALLLQQDNHRFNREAFFDRCGYTPTEAE